MVAPSAQTIRESESEGVLSLAAHRFLPVLAALTLPFSSEAASPSPEVQRFPDSTGQITYVLKVSDVSTRSDAEKLLGLPITIPVSQLQTPGASQADPSPLTPTFFEQLPGGHLLKDAWERASGDAIFSGVTAVATAAVTLVLAWLHRRDWLHRNFKKQVTGFVLQADSDSGPAAVTFLETSISTLLNNSPHSPALVNRIAKTVTPQNPFLGFEDLPGTDFSTDAEQIFAEIANTVSSNAGTQEILAADPGPGEVVDTRQDLVAISYDRYNRSKLRIIDLPLRQAINYLGDLTRSVEQFILHPESCMEVKGRFILALKLATIAFYDNPGRFKREFFKSCDGPTPPNYSWDDIRTNANYLRSFFEIGWQSSVSKLTADYHALKSGALTNSFRSSTPPANSPEEAALGEFNQELAMPPIEGVDPERKYYTVLKLSRILPGIPAAAPRRERLANID